MKHAIGALLVIGSLVPGCKSSTSEPEATVRQPSAELDTTQETESAGRPAEVHRAVREDVAIEATLAAMDGSAPRAGEDARFQLDLRFATDDRPLAGATPAAWMMRRTPGTESAARVPCDKQVGRFLAGSIFSRADVDLNTFYVVTLDDDASLSVVDPLFGFGGSKLLTLVDLPARGEDWWLDAAAGLLWVSTPEAHAVAVVDVEQWRVRQAITLPSAPGRLARLPAAPDGEPRTEPATRVWVALEDGVAVLDAAHDTPLQVIETGAGPHDLALSSDGERLYVSNRGADSVSIIDTRAGKLLRTLATGSEPSSVAWSTAGQTAWVSHAGDGRIVAIGRERGDIRTRLETAPGLERIAFALDGRIAFVVNPGRDEVHVLDAALERVVQTGSFPGGPDQVTFTRELAYVRHRDHSTILMVPLAAVGQPGTPIQVVDFPGGERPFSDRAGTALAVNIVPAPSGTEVLVANPADEMVYFYREGMAAAMGSFSNYGRQPRAVLVLDRSLREVEPGRYQTAARMPAAGTYEVAVFTATPQIAHCFRMAVSPALDDLSATRPVVRWERPGELRAGEPATLELRITGDAGDVAPGDYGLTGRVILVPGSWHQKLPVSHLGGDRFAISFVPPKAGSYSVHVASQVLGLRSRDTASGVEVSAAVEAAYHPGDIPDVAVVDQTGRPRHFVSDVLGHERVVMNFVFTHCATVCSPMGAHFGRLQESLPEDTRLVSVSIDPARDTPERLREWSARFDATDRWTLLTGDVHEVESLLKALDVFTAVREEHAPVVLLGDLTHDRWKRINGLTPPPEVIEALTALSADTDQEQASRVEP